MYVQQRFNYSGLSNKSAWSSQSRFPWLTFTLTSGLVYGEFGLLVYVHLNVFDLEKALGLRPRLRKDLGNLANGAKPEGEVGDRKMKA